ncbi:MAG: diguanylate cyclase [Thiobacillaceae bacterium]|nr:diguanylate cyclase [Thiobacillaceae bacterium]
MHLPSSPQVANLTRRASRRFLVLIGMGFGVLIVLMALFTVHAIWRVSALEDKMRHIVEERNRKIQLASDLQEASHNRHSALVYQVLSTDQFERDEHFQHYIKWGYRVGKARRELKQMPLDAFERTRIDEQDALVVRIVELHESISDLAARGQLQAARDLIERELRPLNLRMTDFTERLLRYERDQISSALAAARHDARSARSVSIALGGSLLALGLLIALVTGRQLLRYARTTCAQMQQLESIGHELEHRATHDPLTGLANRVLFYERLRQDLERARQDGLELMVVYVDLDDFKPVNDRHGHAVGDALLKRVGERLTHAVRSTDTVARLGGDEFALILCGVGGAEEQRRLCRKLEEEVGRPVDIEGLTLVPRCSIGHAIYPEDGRQLEALLNAADAKMYQAKRERKGGPPLGHPLPA